jgi:DNA invertase Pin-like site-specific DNA recombinase
MLVGYARVSLPEQQLALQEDALQQAGCEKIDSDTVSSTQAERPGLTMAIEV